MTSSHIPVLTYPTIFLAVLANQLCLPAKVRVPPDLLVVLYCSSPTHSLALVLH